VVPVASRGGAAAIGPSIHIKGDLSGEEDLLIQGQVEGKIDLERYNVTVGREGRVKADIRGRVIDVEGQVEGNLFGGEQVVIRSAGSVRGNITAPRVSLEDGANFKGAIDMEPQRRERTAAAGGAATKAAAEAGRQLHHSGAFGALLAELRSRPRVAVLDLGPARPENVAFFAALSCRLHVEDLYRSVVGRRGPALPEDVLHLPADAAFDAVLAWDLFDYLEPAILPPLAARLTAACRPGALLFALTSYLGTIPAQPLDFRLAGDDALLYDPAARRSRPGPRHAPRELEQLLPGFRFRTSYLLRSGYQEFLFVRG
jgi:cytoskeletal protein CcmA (bactofilin family)